MRNRVGSVMVLAAVLLLAPVLVLAAAQAPDGQAPTAQPTSIGGCPAETAAFHKCALEKAKTFAPPRTPDGKPDMQGYWRHRLTHGTNLEGVDESEPLTRTLVVPWRVGPGMILEPPDKKIPYQPWAAEIGRKGLNYAKYHDPHGMCLLLGPARDVEIAVHQLIQPLGENSVLWRLEEHHNFRVIHTDGRPHIGKDIKLWEGDSVGRWEGNTLVVDVTNLNGYTWLDDSGNFYTDAAHMVERWTMIDPDTIHYQVTIEDPTTYTRPWTMVWALVREQEPGFELYEEACFEGDRDTKVFLNLGLRYYFGEGWRLRRP